MLIVATYWTCRIKPRLSVAEMLLDAVYKCTVDVTSFLHVCCSGCVQPIQARTWRSLEEKLLRYIYMPPSSAAVLQMGRTQDILPGVWTLMP